KKRQKCRDHSLDGEYVDLVHPGPVVDLTVLDRVETACTAGVVHQSAHTTGLREIPRERIDLALHRQICDEVLGTGALRERFEPVPASRYSHDIPTGGTERDDRGLSDPRACSGDDRTTTH